VPLLDLVLQCKNGIINAKRLSSLYTPIIARPKEVNKKTAAKPAVSFANNSSIPFFFPKIASPPPVMAPDNPALLPDWSNTAAISPIELMIKRMTKAIFNLTNLPNTTLYQASINLYLSVCLL